MLSSDSRLKLKKINNEHVKRIPIPSALDKRPVRGGNICSEVYSNLFLCAKKKSGKTSCIFTIMKKCCDKKTKIVIFCSTAFKDENWIEIRKFFERKGNDVTVHTGIYEDGQDQLANLINELSNETREEEEEEEQVQTQKSQPQIIDVCDNILDRLHSMHESATGRAEPQIKIKCDKGSDNDEESEEEEEPKKKRKSKYKSQEYMIVFDDLSSELKSRSLLALMKKNRHYKSKLLISSQWPHDLLPESRKQLDVILIFKGFTEQKLKELYKDCDSSIPFDTFYAMYKEATEKPFSFMYIDCRNDRIRQNFDKEYII